MKESSRKNGLPRRPDEIGTSRNDRRRTADIKKAINRLAEPPIGEILARVDAFLTKRKIAAYLVGGLVRDALLGRETADIDIAVAADALKVAEKAAKLLKGKYVLLDAQNRIGRVVLEEWVLDFSSFENGIEQDLARRDFTINAMAIGLHELMEGASVVRQAHHERKEAQHDPFKRISKYYIARLIDPFEGREDLRRGVVRAVSEGAFAADPARLLRAVRHAAELGFEIEPSTEALIKRDAHLITNVAGERVREELLRILVVPDSEKSLRMLDNLGLLTGLFPELSATRGVEQPKEHFWDVFEHSLKTVAAVDFLLRKGSWEYKGKQVLAAVPWSAAVEQHFAGQVSHGSTRRSLLKLAGLLHDIAKPQTKSTVTGGRIRFLGHATDGASVAAAMLARLRFSSRESKLVEIEITHHMRPTQMSQEGMPTRRAIYRYFRDTGDAGIDILFLSLADHLAARGPNINISHWREHTGVVEYVLNERLTQENVVRPSKLIDGHDLIGIFGIKPGPAIGRILEKVREEQAAGTIKTRKEALSLIKSEMPIL